MVSLFYFSLSKVRIHYQKQIPPAFLCESLIYFEKLWCRSKHVDKQWSQVSQSRIFTSYKGFQWDDYSNIKARNPGNKVHPVCGLIPTEVQDKNSLCIAFVLQWMCEDYSADAAFIYMLANHVQMNEPTQAVPDFYFVWSTQHKKASNHHANCTFPGVG